MHHEELSKIRQKASFFYVWFLLCHPPLVLFAGWFSGNSCLYETIISFFISAVPVALALKLGIAKAGDSKTFRYLTASSIIALTSLLVYQMRGSWQIDMHMYYFANFAMLTFFCDPLVILSAALLTAIHHLLLNFSFSYAVFPEASFIRVVLHAVIVIVECGILIVLTNYLCDLIKRNHVSMKALQESMEKEKAQRELEKQQEEKNKKEHSLKEKEKEIYAEIETILSQLSDLELSRRIPLQGKEGFILKLVTGINQVMESISNTVMDISHVIQAVAKGDLSAQITAECRGTFSDLKQDINKTLETLKNVVSGISEVTMTVTKGAEDISNKSEEILESMQHQSEKIHDAVITMEQVSSLINENNQNVEHAKELSQTNKEITDNANAIVDEAIDGLQRISDSSENISNITNVIDEIAFQTNLLSLNASVEAARAGEAGKGFAVVASEVRSLADRSSKASKEIKALISKSKEEVVLGAASVNNTGKALKNIAEVTNDSSESIQKIAVSSLEQSSGLMTINNLVKEIDQLNAINRSLIENNKKISYLFKEQIKNQTEKLQNLAAEFSS